MEKTIKTRSAIPVYGVAVVWLLRTIFWGMSSIGDILTAVILSVVVFLVMRTIFPTKVEKIKIEMPEVPKDPELAELEKERDRAITEMHRLNDNIKDAGLTRQINHLEFLTAKIFSVVMEKPEKKSQIRRFLNYYLPTTIKLLNAYDRADATGISGSSINATKTRVENMLSEIEVAFERQLDALFRDEEMDIMAEIRVMESMMSQEGLSDKGTLQGMGK